MQTNYHNKAITPEKVKTKQEGQEFHFPGGGEYAPQTIVAPSREKAEEVWEQTRIKIN